MMGAYGDTICNLCGASYYELDAHTCNQWEVREVFESLRQSVADAEAENAKLKAEVERLRGEGE